MRASRYIETAVYRPGRAITVAGEVAGHLERPLGETTYRYPVLLGREIHLWPQGSPYLHLHIGFGIGFGTRF